MPCAHLSDGPLVVAVDSSTQSTKAIIVDGAGNVLAVAKRKIELLTPAMNHYEHDPRQWWQTTYETIGETLAALSPTHRRRAKPAIPTTTPNQRRPRPTAHQPKRLKTFSKEKKCTPSPSSAPAPWAAH